MKTSTWVFAAMLVGIAPAASADPLLGDPTPRQTPFDRGRISLMGGAGSQNAFGYRYFGVGLGVGYFVVDGLEVGLFGLHEFGDGPSLNEVSPSVRYIAQPLVGRWPVVPYAGVFYNHWFVGDPGSDSDTAGTRAGVVYLSGRLIAGIGVAYEHVLSACVDSCDQIYPDVMLGFTM
ncbi:MAG TPA: hypothetical protein VFK02_35060 [Kofleriaceae bacterium]|nr:hypothetical protein [Kofleriaceae bacterium]